MCAHRLPPTPLPVPLPENPAEALAAPLPRMHPADAWMLDVRRTQADRLRETIRARSEWIDARRRELWKRMDRLQAWTRAAAPAPPPDHGRTPLPLPYAAAVPSTLPGRVLASVGDRLERVLRAVAAAEMHAGGEAAASDPAPGTGATWIPDPLAPERVRLSAVGTTPPPLW